MAKTNLIWLNSYNGAHTWTFRKARELEKKFDKPLKYVEMGSAYGGGLEAMGKRGWECWGFDTFEGHPKHMSKSETSFEAACMDAWYDNPEYGRGRLSYEYQREQLDLLKLDNVHLVKGLIRKNSMKKVGKAHMVLIDLDMIASTRIAFEAVKNYVIKGGYLLMHDALPPHHLPQIYKFVYDEILKDKRWRLAQEAYQSFLAILQRV